MESFESCYISAVSFTPLRLKTCCFTGHRDIPEEYKEEVILRVNKYLFPLFDNGVRYYGVGGAEGFDTLIAKHLIHLRGRKPSAHQDYFCIAVSGLHGLVAKREAMGDKGDYLPKR